MVGRGKQADIYNAEMVVFTFADDAVVSFATSTHRS